MSGDQFVARKRGPPLALAAGDEDGFARFVGERIESLSKRKIAGAPIALIDPARRPTIPPSPPSSAPVRATRSGYRLRHALAPWRSPTSSRQAGVRRAGRSLALVVSYGGAIFGAVCPASLTARRNGNGAETYANGLKLPPVPRTITVP
jgi:hypothetical protein